MSLNSEQMLPARVRKMRQMEDLLNVDVYKRQIEKRGDTYYIEVYNKVEYAEPVEYGHRMKGGGFKKGAHMLEVSLQEMDRKLPDYLRAWLTDFLNTHDLV